MSGNSNNLRRNNSPWKVPSATSIARRNQIYIIGDSQMGFSYNLTGLTTFSYDPVTGICSCTLASHGLVNNQYIAFCALGFPLFNQWKIAVTVSSSSAFSFTIATGLTSIPVVGNCRFGKLGNGFAIGINSWLRAATNGCNIVKTCGVTGDSIIGSTGIMARLAIDILPFAKPGDLVIVQGGINDFLTNGSSAQSVFNALSTGIASLVAAGLRVIYINVSALGQGYGGNTAASRALIIAFNRLAWELPELYNGVDVVDAFGLGVDATISTLTGTSGSGSAKSNFTYTDGLHYSPLLSKAIVNGSSSIQGIATIVNTYYPKRNPLIQCGFDAYDSTSNPTSLNLFQNGGLTTATGGSINNSIAGAIGSQWAVATDTGSGASMTCSVAQSTYGWAGNSAQLAINSGITFTNATQVRFFSAANNAFLLANIIPGNTYRFRAHVKTTGLASLITYLGMEWNWTLDGNAGTVTGALGYNLSDNAHYTTTEFDTYIESEPFTMPAGVSLTSFYWQVNAVFIAGTTGSSCTFELGQVSVESVVGNT